MRAGDLRESLRFEKRKAISDDGYGNREGDWEKKFLARANCKPRKGGSEQVIASRISGVQPYEISIRSCADARLVDHSYRAVDTRNPSRIFNIRSAANFDERNRIVTIWADLGVPT